MCNKIKWAGDILFEYTKEHLKELEFYQQKYPDNKINAVYEVADNAAGD